MIFLVLQRFGPIYKAKCFMVSTFDLTLSSCFLEKQATQQPAGRPVRMKTTLVTVSYWFCNTLYSKIVLRKMYRQLLRLVIKTDQASVFVSWKNSFVQNKVVMKKEKVQFSYGIDIYTRTQIQMVDNQQRGTVYLVSSLPSVTLYTYIRIRGYNDTTIKLNLL